MIQNNSCPILKGPVKNKSIISGVPYLRYHLSKKKKIAEIYLILFEGSFQLSELLL